VLNYGGFIPAFNAADQLYPVAAFAGGNYLVAWLEMRDPATRAVSLWVAPVFSDGTTAPAKMVLPEDPNRSQIALAGNADQFFVSWRELHHSSQTSSDILGAYLRPDGSISDEGIFDINGGSTTWAPSISISPSAGMIIAAKGTRPNTYKVVWNGTQSFEPPMTGVDDFTAIHG